MRKLVYFFGGGRAEGSSQLRTLLGGKGGELAEMTTLGIRVPPGFTITTEAWTEYAAAGRRDPEGLWDEVQQHLARVEELLDRRLGDPERPLLVSVRSGARVSMPGMMETILNLGLNDETVLGLAKLSGSPRFAYDSYRRLLQMYGDVVLGVPMEDFEHLLAAKRLTNGVRTDSELPAEALQALVAEYHALIRNKTGEAFPADPRKQLWGAIE